MALIKILFMLYLLFIFDNYYQCNQQLMEGTYLYMFDCIDSWSGGGCY